MANLLKNLRPFQNYLFKYNGKSIFFYIGRNSLKKILNRNRDILISNLLLESILDFGKWQKIRKYANTPLAWLLSELSRSNWIM